VAGRVWVCGGACVAGRVYIVMVGGRAEDSVAHFGDVGKERTGGEGTRGREGTAMAEHIYLSCVLPFGVGNGRVGERVPSASSHPGHTKAHVGLMMSGIVRVAWSVWSR